ncbi:MAG: SDR family oxidoreductase [Vicinamibacteraceae bacterium]
MTRLLIVGGGGMLGHKLWQIARDRVETWATVRAVSPALAALGVVDDRTISGVDVDRLETLDAALDRARPDVVVNCVGVIKQLAAAKDPVASIGINALYPHVLARAGRARGARVIHISTDCVFDGDRAGRSGGGYVEAELTNATDLYGRTKALGELSAPGTLTVRTSIIGRELSGTSGLVEWFLSRRGGTADGYRGAIFSGFTTAALADILLRVIAEQPALEGLYHVSAPAIDKLALLGRLNTAFAAGVTITPRDEPRIDRSLDSTRFQAATGITPPDWDAMIAALAADPTPYEAIRGLGA